MRLSLVDPEQDLHGLGVRSSQDRVDLDPAVAALPIEEVNANVVVREHTGAQVPIIDRELGAGPTERA